MSTPNGNKQTVLLYPKTSCTECKGSYPIPQPRIPTNMLVENCEYSPYFDHYNTVEINTNTEPRDNNKIYELNPQAYNGKVSTDFNRVACKVSPTCPEPSFIAMDPRLYSQTLAQYLPLDRPPINGDVKLKDIYDDKYTNYGLGSKPYHLIDDGQIVYYVDQSIQDANFKPVFSEPAKEVIEIYKDPMGSMKINATRYPLLNTENPTVTTPNFYPYCLSSIQDSQSFREDLMSFQMRGSQNQNKWTVRWT